MTGKSAVVVLVGSLAWGAASAAPGCPPAFADHFLPRAMRIDLVHAGTADRETFVLDRVREEPFWGGPYGRLVDAPRYGQHEVRVTDPATGRLLYRAGFSSLFGEWQTTGEAEAGPARAFEEPVRIPWPRAPVDVVVATRGRDGQFRDAWQARLDPASPGIDRSRRFTGLPVDQVEVNAPPDRAVDVLVLGDGYTAAEAGKFHRDVRRFARVLLGTEPFASNRARISVRAVQAPSADPGPDEPRRGLFRDTGLSTTFNTFGSARYLTTAALRDLRDLAALAPYDTLVVLVNTSRYGGGGIYGLYAVFPSDNEYDEYVLVHEFGHGFAGLGDEYYTSSVAYSDFYPRGVEPWEPNVTALLPGAPVKWGAQIPAGVPIPTPEDPARFGAGAGVFEGAGYAAKGLYRPAIDCKMFSKGKRGFCPVCRKAIEDMIESLVQGKGECHG